MRQEVQCIDDRAYRVHKGLEPRYLLFELRNFPMIIAYELAPTVNKGYKPINLWCSQALLGNSPPLAQPRSAAPFHQAETPKGGFAAVGTGVLQRQVAPYPAAARLISQRALLDIRLA